MAFAKISPPSEAEVGELLRYIGTKILQNLVRFGSFLDSNIEFWFVKVRVTGEEIRILDLVISVQARPELLQCGVVLANQTQSDFGPFILE